MISRCCYLFAVCAVLLYGCAARTGSRISAGYQDAPKVKAHNGLAPLATAGNQLHYRDSQLCDSSPLLLTANTDTVYCVAFLDLQTDGSTVVEIPSGCARHGR
jgi:hypothetical protein